MNSDEFHEKFDFELMQEQSNGFYHLQTITLHLKPAIYHEIARAHEEARHAHRHFCFYGKSDWIIRTQFNNIHALYALTSQSRTQNKHEKRIKFRFLERNHNINDSKGPNAKVLCMPCIHFVFHRRHGTRNLRCAFVAVAVCGYCLFAELFDRRSP